MELEQCGNGGSEKARVKAASTRTLKAVGISREMADTAPAELLEGAMKARGLSQEFIDIEMQRKQSRKPNDNQGLNIIKKLDRELKTNNYLNLYELRKELSKSGLSREEQDQMLYRLQRSGRIQIGALQEKVHYSDEQLKAAIPREFGGELFFVTRN